jgi:hypothetical protein
MARPHIDMNVSSDQDVRITGHSLHGRRPTDDEEAEV